MSVIACKINKKEHCEFDAAWLCKNPDCKNRILTSTLIGARPHGCPLVDKWNSKKAEEEELHEQF